MSRVSHGIDRDAVIGHADVLRSGASGAVLSPTTALSWRTCPKVKATPGSWPPGRRTGEILHARMRKGSANTARGAWRFIKELVPRLRRAGALGEIVLRVDSGFWSKDTIATLARLDVRYTMTVRIGNSAVARVMAAIDDNAWPISTTPPARPRWPRRPARGGA